MQTQDQNEKIYNALGGGRFKKCIVAGIDYSETSRLNSELLVITELLLAIHIIVFHKT